MCASITNRYAQRVQERERR